MQIVVAELARHLRQSKLCNYVGATFMTPVVAGLINQTPTGL